MFVFYRLNYFHGDEGGVRTAFCRFIVESWDPRCLNLSAWLPSGQLTCFGLDGIS